MGGVVIAWLFLVSIAHAIHVNVTGTWQPNIGVEVVCTWETLPNDTLQSVRLYKDGQQFMIYRPETDGQVKSEALQTPKTGMYIDCATTRDRGQEGSCKMLLAINQPSVLHDFMYTCEVYGERPMFWIEKKDYLVRILVPPTNATLVSKVDDESSQSRVMLNCSSTGLPAPRLQWSLDNNFKLQADSTDRYWNATSKLWHVWSYLSYNKTSHVKVLCSPEVTTQDGVIKGIPAEFNSAMKYLGTNLVIISFLILFR